VLTPKDTLSIAYSVLTRARRSGSRPRTSSFLVRHPEPRAVPRQLLQAARLRVPGDSQIPFNVRTFEELGLPGCGKTWPSGARPVLVDGAHRVWQEHHARALIDKINKELKGTSSRWRTRSSSSTAIRAAS